MSRRYRLVAKLEESAVAELYRGVVDGPGGHEVLVKLHAPRASDPAFGRALAEINAKAMTLNHPGVLGYLEVGMVRGRIAAIRPYVEGYNLGEALRRLSSKEVVITPALAIFIVAEAAQAVAAAHLQNWIHGALTPGNILLGKDGRVRVVDFGVLTAMNASEALKAFVGKGRQAYRAPELKMPGTGSPSADVYSLGAILYELITLREVASIRGGGLSTKRDGLMPPSRLDRRLNVRLDGPIMRALDTAATRRYRSAAELADALRGLFTTLGYAPGTNELVKFVGELFPNEVSVGGGMGEVAFTDPFTVEPFDPAAVFDFPEEPSGFQLDERDSFTSADLQAYEPEEAAPAETSSASRSESFEDWEAPPGVMPDAPRLNRARIAARVEPPASAYPSAAEDRSTTIEQPALVLPTEETGAASMRAAPPAASGTRPSSRRRRQDTVQDAAFDAEDLAPGEHAATEHDWHVPPEPPPPPPPQKPTVGIGSWLVAAAVFAAFAGVVYLLLAKQLGLDGALSNLVKSEAPVAPILAATPIEGDPTPEPEPEPAREPKKRTRRERRAAPRAPPGLLTVEADQPAQIFIDGKDTGLRTPLKRHSLPAGKYTVLLVTDDNRMREMVVTIAAGEEVARRASFAEARKPRKRSR